MKSNLEKFKKINQEYQDSSAKSEIIVLYLIPILEDFEKRLETIEDKLRKWVK